MISLLVILCLCFAVFPGTARAAQTDPAVQAQERVLPYRLADAEEGAELMLANAEYYAGFSQNDLDYKTQKKNATMEEYQAFARQQVLDFTDVEAALIEEYFLNMEASLAENGYVLPSLGEIVFIKTTMAEECYVGGYTHDTQLYVSGMCLMARLKGTNTAWNI